MKISATFQALSQAFVMERVSDHINPITIGSPPGCKALLMKMRPRGPSKAPYGCQRQCIGGEAGGKPSQNVVYYFFRLDSWRGWGNLLLAKRLLFINESSVTRVYDT